MSIKHLAHLLLVLGMGILHAPAYGQTSSHSPEEEAIMSQQQSLTERQQAIVPVAAFAAVGDLTALSTALNQGLDAGMTINDAREVLVQLYAYAGFPRSLNALGTLMAVLEDRRQNGIVDIEGQTPVNPIPKGDALMEQGTANQTKLAGGPVKGPVFDFAPAADEYLKTHLFGDIFARDNMSWQDREISTVAMLAAISGVEPQLQAHIGIGMNAGLTESQLQLLSDVLGERVDAASAARVRNALKQRAAK